MDYETKNVLFVEMQPRILPKYRHVRYERHRQKVLKG